MFRISIVCDDIAISQFRETPEFDREIVYRYGFMAHLLCPIKFHHPYKKNVRCIRES